jgi:hypothetical protein
MGKGVRAMAIRTADAEWRGNLAQGSGHMRRSPISEAQMALLDREGSGAAIEVPGEAVFCALGGTHLERTITTSTLRDSLRPR